MNYLKPICHTIAGLFIAALGLVCCRVIINKLPDVDWHFTFTMICLLTAAVSSLVTGCKMFFYGCQRIGELVS